MDPGDRVESSQRAISRRGNVRQGARSGNLALQAEPRVAAASGRGSQGGSWTTSTRTTLTFQAPPASGNGIQQHFSEGDYRAWLGLGTTARVSEADW